MLSTRILFPLITLLSCTSLWAQNLIIECPHNNISFTVDVAKTVDEQKKGLMFRETLDEHAGMIFLYTTPTPVAMWMKNTPLPLDMIFADEKGAILDLYENATPYSLDVIGPVVGVTRVLEVNGGIIKKHGITKACRLQLAPTPSP